MTHAFNNPTRHSSQSLWAEEVRASTWKLHAKYLLIITVLIGCMGGYRLGDGDITQTLEAGYILTVQEMVRDDHWLVPTQNHRPRIVKPPAPFWVNAVMAKLIHGDHVSVWLARGMSVFVLLLAALLLYAMGVVWFDPRTGFWASVIWSTGYLISAEFRLARHDSYLTFGVMLLMLGISGVWKQRWWAWLVTLLGMLVAVQVKGPVVWLLAVLPAVVFIVLWPLLHGRSSDHESHESEGGTAVAQSDGARRYRKELRWGMILGLLGLVILSGLTLLPWPIYTSRALGMNLFDAYAWEGFGRVVDAPMDPLWYYLWRLFYFAAPWTLYLIAGLVSPFLPEYRRWKEGLTFALIWLVMGLILMSLPKEKAQRYFLPLMAPAALLCARVVAYQVALAIRGLKDHGGGALWIGQSIFMGVVSVVLPLVLYLIGAVPLSFLIALGVGLGVIAFLGAWAYTRGLALIGAWTTLIFGVVMWLGFHQAREIAPTMQEPLREVAVKTRKIMDGRQAILWPELKLPRAYSYYGNFVAPKLVTPYRMLKQFEGELTEDRLKDILQTGADGYALRTKAIRRYRERWQEAETQALKQAAQQGLLDIAAGNRDRQLKAILAVTHWDDDVIKARAKAEGVTDNAAYTLLVNKLLQECEALDQLHDMVLLDELLQRREQQPNEEILVFTRPEEIARLDRLATSAGYRMQETPLQDIRTTEPHMKEWRWREPVFLMLLRPDRR